MTRGRACCRILAVLGLAFSLVDCARRAPVLAPPSGPVDAVEGYAQASVESEAAAIKGKFSFLFRRPGLGRVEALDPLARTIYYLVFGESRAFFVLPSKKAYVEDSPETLMGHFLGFALLPDDILRLLSSRWADVGLGCPPQDAWQIVKDKEGRVVRVQKQALTCEIKEFFGKSAVPRIVAFSAAGTLGRMKVLTLRFNPPPRPEAFETTFLIAYTRKSWDEIHESLKNER